MSTQGLSCVIWAFGEVFHMPQTTSKPDKTVSDEVYISIPEAIERGYSSRATINR